MNLTGTRVLVVEDDALIRLMVVAFLEDLGCVVVATASQLADALQKATRVDLDVGVLDINLAGQPSYPIGEVLLARGIPFVFSTAYGADIIPASFRRVPLLTKPFDERQLATQLRLALQEVRK